MRALRTLAVPLIALVLVSPALAQGTEEKKNLVIIDVDKDMELREFLDLISKATGKPLLYDPNGQRIRNQKMGSTFSHRVPEDKLFITFRAILSFYELTLVPIGPKGYEIFLAIDSRSTNNFVKNKAVYVDHRQLQEYEDHDGLYISCAIPVQHIDNLTTLRTALSTMVSPAGIGRVHEVPGSNNIIIMDFAPTVAAMAKLIGHMDVESPTKKMVMEFITLEHAYADEVADIISELVAVQRQANVPARRGSTRVASESPEPRIIAYEPKNALVVASTQDDFLRIQSLIDQFDQPGEQISLVEVIRLNHVQAEDVADTLTQVLEGMGGQLGSQSQQATRPGQRPRGAGTQRTGGSSQDMEPQVVPDPATNSLILAADTKTISALKNIIEQLDLPKDQVLIEASLIALIRTDDFQLGVELVGVDETGLNSSTASGFGVTNFGLSTFEDTDGDLIPDINVPTALQTGGGGLVAGIFRNGGIPIMLTALQQLNNAKVLSMPSVVTYDNSAATLQSLQDAAVGAQAELSSGSLQQGFDGYESAGVTLVVSPHISADEYLRLDIELEVSSFQGDVSPDSSTGLPPPRQRNIINTTIALPNEHTVVMGGLIGEDETLSESKVPLLGDIPVLGYLFKNKSRTKVKRNLFIFVTPHILRQHGVDFTELHKQTWIAKMKADELIEHIEIHNANFKLDPRFKDPEDLGQAMLDVSSHVDAGRFQEVPAEIALQELQSLRRRVPGLAQKEIEAEAADD
ncbi:MAG: secretin N-terminal domain-containing protein [Planctomycetota bacterium]|jgi:general secretion pathway protein D